MNPLRPVRRRSRGSALLTVIMLVAVMALLTGSMLQYSTGEQRSNERNRLTLRARNMSENISVYAAEQLTAKLNRLRSPGKMAFLTGSNKISLPPSSVLNTSFTKESDMEVYAGIMDATDMTYIDPTTNPGNPNAGLSVSTSLVPIVSKATATHPSIGSVTSYTRHDLEVAMIPLFQFAVFYNMDMEFAPGADMRISGPVHTNGSLIARMQSGKTNLLEFDDRVTAVGGFYANTGHKGPTVMADGTTDDGPGGTGTLNFTHATTKAKTNIYTSTGKIWRDHEYSSSPETATENATSLTKFKSFATSTYAGNLRTGVHGVTPLQLPSVSNYKEQDDPDTAEDERDNGRQIIEPPDPGDSAGLKGTKFGRRTGLYIIVNPDDETRNGALPDGTPVAMRARSYRCWLNTVNADLSHSYFEVVLPGQPSYGTLNGFVNTLPNAYRVDTSVGHNQVLRIPQGGGVDAAGTGYSGPAIPTFSTITDAYFYDLRRATGNTGHPQYRSSTNLFTPRPIAKIDFDMTRFKMAVERSLLGATKSTVYNVARPTDSTWSNFIFNKDASPAEHGLGIGTSFDVFPTETPLVAVKKTAGGELIPSQITVRAWEQPGNGGSATRELASRFVVATSTNGSTYTDVYTSAADEESITYAVPNGVTHIRVRMYLGGDDPASNRLCDEEIIPVIDESATGVVSVISNSYHVVPTSNGSGNPPSWAYDGTATEMRVFVDGADDTPNWRFSVTAASNANGSFESGLNANRFKPSSLTNNSGSIRLRAKKGATTTEKEITLKKQASVSALTTPANRARWITITQPLAADPFRIYRAPLSPSDPPIAVLPSELINTAATTSPWFDGITVYIHSVDAENRKLVSGVPERVDSGVRLWHGRGSVISLDPKIDSGYTGRTGFSFATNDAVYVVGHFNADGKINSTVSSTSNPGGYSGRYPESDTEMLTSIMGDATTILSQPVFYRDTSPSPDIYYQISGWSDSLSAYVHTSSGWSSDWRKKNPSSSNYRDGLYATVTPAAMPNVVSIEGESAADRKTKFGGSDTEISSCFLIGIVPTNHNPTGLTDGAPSAGANGQTSGGVHNYPRLLEFWDGDLYIRGSMVAMFESRVGMEPWSIRYYNAPGRYWGLHQSLRDKDHDLPLEPMLLNARRMRFKEITAAEYAKTKQDILDLPH